jgi:hypothetical protein
MSRLGKVVKSNSHCDYVVQVDDPLGSDCPPNADEYGFGSFVKIEDEMQGRHWAVGLVYNSQLFNPQFLSMGPRLSSDPDPLFSPDQIYETRTLLGTVLIGWLKQDGKKMYGIQSIPKVVVPINAEVSVMTEDEVHRFHRNEGDRPQFCYYSHLLRNGGTFAAQLLQQVLIDLMASPNFNDSERRSLDLLCKELAWKNTMGAMR